MAGPLLNWRVRWSAEALTLIALAVWAFAAWCVDTVREVWQAELRFESFDIAWARIASGEAVAVFLLLPEARRQRLCAEEDGPFSDRNSGRMTDYSSAIGSDSVI